MTYGKINKIMKGGSDQDGTLVNIVTDDPPRTIILECALNIEIKSDQTTETSENLSVNIIEIAISDCSYRSIFKIGNKVINGLIFCRVITKFYSSDEPNKYLEIRRIFRRLGGRKYLYPVFSIDMERSEVVMKISNALLVDKTTGEITFREANVFYLHTLFLCLPFFQQFQVFEEVY